MSALVPRQLHHPTQVRTPPRCGPAVLGPGKTVRRPDALSIISNGYTRAARGKVQALGAAANLHVSDGEQVVDEKGVCAGTLCVDVRSKYAPPLQAAF